MKIKKKISNILSEQQKELINILMDSELYFDLPLEERYMLLKFIRDSYFVSYSNESKKNLPCSPETDLSLQLKKRPSQTRLR
jgi:hypothetical protein